MTDHSWTWRLGGFVERLFEKHKLARRLLLLWAVLVITWVVLRVFTRLDLLTMSVASALGIVVGLLTLVIAHYQWARAREDVLALKPEEPLEVAIVEMPEDQP